MPSASDAPASVRQTEAGGRSRRRFTVDSLFADHRPQAVGVADLPTGKEIRLDRIEPDPDQPRRTFDPDKLAELADSIRREGVLQPIAVRYDAARDVYVVLHGERRWRAAREVGLASIPAVVRDVPDDRRLIQQLMENIVRDDLNAVDRAAALRALKAQLGDVPWETVAEAVGIRRSRLFQLLGTEKLSPSARADIRSGRLSEKQSRALQGLSPQQQEALRAAIVDGDLPADEAMRLSRELRTGPGSADVRDAAATIEAWRSSPPPSDLPPDGAVALLSSIAAGRSGAPRRRESSSGPPFDGRRLQSEVAALARTLARANPDDVASGTAARTTLTLLRDAIDTLLAGDRTRSAHR